MNISSTDARALFTKLLVDVYQERVKPTMFIKNTFFPNSIPAPTAEVAIEVTRGFEFVANDVVRGTEGNRNTFSKSTEKVFIPPIYREYFDVTQLDFYERVMGSQGNANENIFTALMNTVSNKLGVLQDMIDRRFELQCAQVLMDGIVTCSAQLSIDFKRKAGSMVDLGGAGGYFAANSELFDQFAAAAYFLRVTGKSGDSRFVAICGETALENLKKNTKFTTRQNLFHMQLDQVKAPIRNAEGAAYHGTITAGAYMFDLVSYPQVYETISGTTITAHKYIDDKYIACIPQTPRFKFTHAAVPQLLGKPGDMPSQPEYVIGEFTDQRKATHEVDIQSAAIPIPVAVDQIYTMKAVA